MAVKEKNVIGATQAADRMPRYPSNNHDGSRASRAVRPLVCGPALMKFRGQSRANGGAELHRSAAKVALRLSKGICCKGRAALLLANVSYAPAPNIVIIGLWYDFLSGIWRKRLAWRPFSLRRGAIKLGDHFRTITSISFSIRQWTARL